MGLFFSLKQQLMIQRGDGSGGRNGVNTVGGRGGAMYINDHPMMGTGCTSDHNVSSFEIPTSSTIPPQASATTAAVASAPQIVIRQCNHGINMKLTIDATEENQGGGDIWNKGRELMELMETITMMMKVLIPMRMC